MKSEGRGTRKRSAAHAVLVRGTGLFRVNGEQERAYSRAERMVAELEV